MQNNMQIWLESSTTTFNLNSHDEGVYLVSDLDGLTSLPEIRTSQGVNTGTDGGWTSAQAFDARLISLNIVIANEDESIVESKRRTLNSLLAQSRKESLKLHFISEAGMEYVISVRVTNVSGALSNILKKQNLLIQMRADDPIIYGAQGGEGADATLTVQQAQGGFEIPFDIPLIIDGGTDKVNVENLGSEEVYPVIKMTGPLHNPTVVNETQNAEIGVNADLGDMEWRGYESEQLFGNATQETLSGKNIFNTNGSTTHSSGGIDTTWSGNVGTASGTTTSTSFIATDTVSASIPAGTYTFSVQTAVPYKVVIALYNSNTSSWVNDNVLSANQQTITFTTNFTASNWRIGVSSIPTGTTISNLKIDRPMLEVGSTATAFEPYTGGSPMPNPQFPSDVNVVTGGQTVKILGKNLFNFQEFAEDKIQAGGCARGTATATDNSITLTATANDCYTRYGFTRGYPPVIKVLPNTNYTLSWQSDNTSGTTKGLVYIFGNNNGSAVVEGNTPDYNGRISFNTGDFEEISFRLGVSTSGNSLTYSNIQLELGDQATAYEPYQGQSYTIDLGSIELAKIGTYQDYIYNDGGKWYKHAEVGKRTYTGASAEGWSLGYTKDTTCLFQKRDIFVPTPTGDVPDAKCNYFTADSNPNIYGGDTVGFTFNITGYLRINVLKTLASDVESLMTWLSTHNTTVYYALATPTDTQITDSELIGQLEAILNYSPYYGTDQNVFLIPSSGADGTFILGAPNDPKPADEVLIDTQMKTVTFNGQNIYNKLTEGSSFFTLAPGDNTMYLTSDVSSDTGKAEIKFKQGFISI